MPLPNDRQPNPAPSGHVPDDLDAYLQAHLETCACCRSTVDHASCEPGAASRQILSQSVLIDLLSEPAFQHAESQIQNLSVADLVGSEHVSPTAEVGLQIGNYRLLEPIARGGMGRVYRAIHVDLNKIVAVKLLTPQRAGNAAAVERFRREMQALGRFSHPHVVTATDGGEDDGHCYLVMEFVEGLDLSTLVNRLGPLRVADAAELIRQAALGVQAIHRHGVVHRDVKPSNIMLSREGVVKVLDLGLSRFASMQDDDGALTEAGQVLGTKRFMAPEQFQTNRVDSRADLYSLGASLWCLLSGEPPPLPETAVLSEETEVRGGASPSRTLFARRDDVPQELAAILNRFTAHAPSDRAGTAGELAAVLQPFCEGSDLRGLLMRAWDAIKDSTLSEESLEHRTPSSATQASRIPRRLSWAVLLVVLLAAGTLLTMAALNGKLLPGSTPADQTDNPPSNSLAKESPPGKRKPQTPFERQQERDVAVWVLKRGGRVTRHPHGSIRRPEEIPDDGPFRIRKIMLVNRGITDGDLKRFQQLSLLDSLALKDNSRLTNDGVAKLARIDTLRWLYLGGTQISDAGLSQLNRLPRLESLGLEGTAVTDKGLVAIAQLKHLRELQLDKTGITDDGLKHLRNFHGLVRLDLSSTRVTNAGLKHLVKAAPQIRFLGLKLTRISDAGVPPLKELRHLEELNLEQTAVTRQGVETLRRALAGCKVTF